MCRNVALTFFGHIQYYILTLSSVLVSVEWCSKTVVNCWGNKEDFPWSQLVLLYSNISALDCQITVIPLLWGCSASPVSRLLSGILVAGNQWNGANILGLLPLQWNRIHDSFSTKSDDCIHITPNWCQTLFKFCCLGTMQFSWPNS